MPRPMTPIATCVGAFAWFALTRSLAEALGGDGRAAALVTAACAAAFAAGAAFGARALKLRIAAAAIGTLAVVLAPHAEAALCGAVVAGGDAWRGDIVTFLIAALAAGAPCTFLGACAAESRASAASMAAAVGAAIVFADSPWIPAGAVNALACAAPAMMLFFRPAGGAASGGDGVRRGAADAALFIFGAAIALAAAAARLQVRTFLRGTAWDRGEVDAVLCLGAALGAAVIARSARDWRAHGAALFAGCALFILWLGSLRLASWSTPGPFADYLHRFHADRGALGIDGDAYAALLAFSTFFAGFLALGAAGDAALFERGRRGFAALAAGVAAGAAAAIVLCEGGSTSHAGNAYSEGGLARTQFWLGPVLAAAAVAAYAGVPLPRGKLRFAGFALVIAPPVLAFFGPFGSLAPVEMLPVSNFLSEPRMKEIHELRSVRESIDGVCQLVSEPSRRGRDAIVRAERVRVNRTGVTPGYDGEQSLLFSAAAAVAAHGSAKSMLYVGAPTAAAIEQLHHWGVARIETAPNPAGASAVIRGYGTADSIAPGDDGLRCAAGRRGYDIVYIPPQPVDSPEGAALLRPPHLRALESALANDGVLAASYDLLDAPAGALDAVIAACATHGPRARAAWTGDGVWHPALTLLIAAPGRAALDTFSTATAALVRKELPAFPAARDEWIALAPRADEWNAPGTSWENLLPPVAAPRLLEAARVPGGVRKESSPARTAMLRRVAEQAPANSIIVRSLASAAAALDGSAYIINPFKSFLEQAPLPDAAAAGVVAALKASPEHPTAWRAYAQISAQLRRQDLFSRLGELAKETSAAAPAAWRPARDAAYSLRALLAPEMGLETLDRVPAPADPQARLEMLIERAACEEALGHKDQALKMLKNEVQRAPANASLARALADMHAARGEWNDALLWARHYNTVAPSEETEHYLEGLERRAKKAAAQQPQIGPPDPNR